MKNLIIEKVVEYYKSYINSFYTIEKCSQFSYWVKGVKDSIADIAFINNYEITINEVDEIYNSIIKRLKEIKE